MDPVTLGMAKSDAARRFLPVPDDRIVLLGNSRVFREYDGNSTSAAYWDSGIFTWANAMAGGPFNVVKGAGVSGNWLSDMITRWPTDVAPYKPSWVYLSDHINDVPTTPDGSSFDTIKARYETLFRMARQIGARVIATTSPPKGTLGASAAALNEQLNRWLLDRADRSVVVANLAAVVTDPLTGLWITGFDDAGDGLHQGVRGAVRMARVLAPVLANLMPPKDRFPTSPLDANNGVLNFSNAGTDGSGAPDQWTSDGVGTFSHYARDAFATGYYRANPLPGGWAKVVGTGTDANFRQTLAALPAGFAVGDKVRLIAEVQLTSLTNYEKLDAILNLQNSSSTTTMITSSIRNRAATLGASIEDIPLNTPLILQTPTVTIPAGTTKWQIQRRFRGVGTALWGRTAVVKEV